MNRVHTPRLPTSLAQAFSECASETQRCADNYEAVESMSVVATRAYECATLCRAAASLLERQALLGSEVARLAVAAALLCNEACVAQTEPTCRSCGEACRRCAASYRKVAYRSGPSAISERPQ